MIKEKELDMEQKAVARYNNCIPFLKTEILLFNKFGTHAVISDYGKWFFIEWNSKETK